MQDDLWMPELPDVENTAKSLRKWASGHRIRKVLAPQGVRQRSRLSPAEFARRVQGRKVRSVSRKGKWILVRLSEDAGLGVHLGMTGDFKRDHEAKGARLSRAHFLLDNGTWIHFVDPRRFGKMIAAVHYEDLLRNPAISEVGPDALSELTSDQLRHILKKSKRAIKEVLMDQHAMAGIGNVYATEALWLAKVHPTSSANGLAGQARKLLRAIHSSLRRGLNAYEREREFDPHVYGRSGMPCPRCGTKLDAIRLGARTSVFCPHCQRR